MTYNFFSDCADYVLKLARVHYSKDFEPEASQLVVDQAVQELQSDKSDTMVDRVTPQLSKHTMGLNTQADIREDIVNTCNKLAQQNNRSETHI